MMRHSFRKALIAAAVALSASVPAVSAEWNDSIRYHGELVMNAGGGDHNPFWFASDMHGLASVKPNSGWLRLGAFHDIDRDKRFSWGAGVDLAVALRNTSVFIPHQIYGEVKYRCLNLLVGQKVIPDPIVNSDLSSGALVYSGNARPIPQVRIGIFDYADFWGCKGWFAVKGYIAYGMFTDSHWIEDWVHPSPGSPYSLNTLYCSRGGYLRGGNPDKFPLTGEIGLNMETEFGGTSYFTYKDGSTRVSPHPTYLKAWLKALIPMGGGADTDPGEQVNVEGNMLGNWSFALRWDDPAGWMVRAYWQHMFEDHSMLFFDYPWKDGLYGVEARLPKNRFVSEIVAEFLYSKDQAGPVYWDHVPTLNVQISSRDNYFNHYIYSGWQNWGMCIGNPFYISPIYNKDHVMRFYHNRIVAYHLGFKGSPSPQVDYRIKASLLRSWGAWGTPTPKVEKNFSLLAEVKWHPGKLKGWEGSLSFGMDAGSIIGNSYGARIAITKTGWLFAPKKK